MMIVNFTTKLKMRLKRYIIITTKGNKPLTRLKIRVRAMKTVTILMSHQTLICIDNSSRKGKSRELMIVMRVKKMMNQMKMLIKVSKTRKAMKLKMMKVYKTRRRKVKKVKKAQMTMIVKIMMVSPVNIARMTIGRKIRVVMNIFNYKRNSRRLNWKIMN